jgi:cell division protein FtsW (lipid II flippase)
MSQGQIIWLLCGFVGVAIFAYKDPSAFKKARELHPLGVLILLWCLIVMGPFIRYGFNTPKLASA